MKHSSILLLQFLIALHLEESFKFWGEAIISQGQASVIETGKEQHLFKSKVTQCLNFHIRVQSKTIVIGYSALYI